MQEEEEVFIVLVLSLLEEESSPERCIKKLEKTIDVETKNFVKALWRFIIFEQLKIKAKLV